MGHPDFIVSSCMENSIGLKKGLYTCTNLLMSTFSFSVILLAYCTSHLVDLVT